jgi:hypothetical protein
MDEDAANSLSRLDPDMRDKERPVRCRLVVFQFLVRSSRLISASRFILTMSFFV